MENENMITLYLEHMAGDYFLVEYDDDDYDSHIWKVWTENDFTERKLNNAMNKIKAAAPKGTEVEMKVRCEV